jgi:hypothetical protein
VGHDIGIECDTPQDFLRALSPGMLAGTCETGAGFAWPLFQREMADARYVVIRRPLGDVNASMDRVGLTASTTKWRSANNICNGSAPRAP